MSVADLLSSSEAVREREGAPASSPRSPLAPVLSTAFPEIDATRETWMDKRGDVETARAEQQAAVAPFMQKANRIAETQRAEIPPRLALQPAPSPQLTDFLAPVKGEKPETSIAKMFDALGLFAIMGGSIARKHAAAGAAALTGALTGWREGDQDRGKREFAAWRANTEKAIEEHRADLDLYKAKVEERKGTFEEALQQAQMAAWEKGHKVLAAQFTAETYEKALGQMEKEREFLQNLQLRYDTLAQSHDDKMTQLGIMERLRQAEIDSRMRIAQLHAEIAMMHQADKQTRLNLQLMRGGPWVNKQSGQVIDNVTREEWDTMGGHENFKPITKQQMQNFDILEGEAFPQIDQMRTVGERILARYPGQNIGKLLELSARGKLSDPDVREYQQARNALTFSLGRVLGGGTTLRKFVFEALEGAEVATLGDTKETMNRMTENSRMAIMNFMRASKGMSALPMPSQRRTFRVGDQVTGPEGTASIKLDPYEPLPAGWGYRY